MMTLRQKSQAQHHRSKRCAAMALKPCYCESAERISQLIARRLITVSDPNCSGHNSQDLQNARTT